MANKVLLAAAFGIFLHNAVLAKGEWHLKAPRLVLAHLASFISILFFETRSAPFCSAFKETCLVSLGYSAAIASSISAYRAFFHRLRLFPGPPLAKVSKIWHASHCLDCQNHLFLEDLRHRYGPFVRTGPNELTIFHPDIHRAIDGPGNSCTKSVWYDIINPDISLVSARDKKLHDERRRLWFKGFGTEPLAQYEERVLQYVHKLETQIEAAASQKTPVTINDIFYWFGWDVMGESTFGRSFDMLENEQWHVAVLMLKRALRILGPITPIPWLAHIAFTFIPGLWAVADWNAMKRFCRQRMNERIETESTKTDISSWLIQDAKGHGFRDIDRHWLNGDAILAIVAGSDPVAATLTFLFSHLAEDHSRQERLFAELESVDVHDINALKPLQYLNSLVNETLRLNPPLMTGGLRETGPNGITVGGTYIPGNVTIVAPKYSTSRLESCFVQPEDFIPERWTTRPELIKDAKAYNPFGVGRHSCVGKNIAWSEMRFVTAAIVSKYHVHLAPGEDGKRVSKELRDYFTPAPGRLDLVFEVRS